MDIAVYQDGPFRDREGFALELIGTLGEALQSFIGLEDSAGVVAIVANRLARRLDAALLHSNGGAALDIEQVAQALVDLKRRIGGEFRVAHLDARRIVLVNTRCPFGQHAEGRPALCAMTSGVFGHLVAQSVGYARVSLDATIARGDAACHVTIDLDPGGTDGGVEYFADRSPS